MRDELLRRRLNTLEDCRALWEAACDPMALMVGVTLADLPHWLQDALLVALDPTEASKMIAQLQPLGFRASKVFMRFMRQQWRKSGQDREHAARAWEVLLLRTHPKLGAELPISWYKSSRMAAHRLKERHGGEIDLPTGAAMAQSYARVARQVRRDPWRFWAPHGGFHARYDAALPAVLAVIERAIQTQTRPPEARREPRSPRRK